MAPPASIGYKKYGSPLYGCAWGIPGTILLAGGGGAMACGLKNRIMAVSCDEVGHLSEPVLAIDTGKALPSRMALHPSGKDIICGFDEGCAHYKLALPDLVEGKDKGSLASVDTHQKALGSLGEQKCITFSPKGDMLALGSEDGTIRIFGWPDMKLHVTQEKAHGKPITDLAFDAEGGSLLSVSQERATAENGAKVWTLEKAEKGLTIKQKSVLWDGAKYPSISGSHRGGALACNSIDLVFTGFNSNKRTGPDSYIMRWDGLCATGHTIAHKDGKITSLAITPNGKVLATGSSEGEVLMFETKRLVKVARLRNIHEVFVTTLAFSPDSTRLLSASGDTSAHVAPVTDKPPSLQSLPIFLILLMAAIAYIIQRYMQAAGEGIAVAVEAGAL